MPIYEYQCEECHSQFEFMQKTSDPLKKKCPKCGGRLKKLVSSPAIQFKGSGWYITDYARKKPEKEAAHKGKPVPKKEDKAPPPSSSSSDKG